VTNPFVRITSYNFSSGAMTAGRTSSHLEHRASEMHGARIQQTATLLWSKPKCSDTRNAFASHLIKQDSSYSLLLDGDILPTPATYGFFS
jgi:hypothetical protein